MRRCLFPVLQHVALGRQRPTAEGLSMPRLSVLTGALGAPKIGDDTRHAPEALARQSLSPGLQIPKNRSTGNLGTMGDSSERARIRFSFDAGAAAAEYDSMSRSA